MTTGMAIRRATPHLFWLAAMLDIVLALLLNYADRGGSDAAGNGLEAAFAFLIMIGTFLIVIILSGLFALIKRTWFRVSLIVAAYGLGLVLLINLVA